MGLVGELLFSVADRAAQPLDQRRAGLPSQFAARRRDVGRETPHVVGAGVGVYDLRAAARQGDDLLGQRTDRNLVAAAEIDRRSFKWQTSAPLYRWQTVLHVYMDWKMPCRENF